MSRQATLQECCQAIDELLPEVPAPERKALGALVCGVVHAESAQLSRASAAVPGEAQDRSKQRRAQRLVANERLDIGRAQRRLLARVLRGRRGRVDLLLDATTNGATAEQAGTVTLVLALRWHGRAVPLVWQSWIADEPGQRWLGPFPGCARRWPSTCPRVSTPSCWPIAAWGTWHWPGPPGSWGGTISSASSVARASVGRMAPSRRSAASCRRHHAASRAASGNGWAASLTRPSAPRAPSAAPPGSAIGMPPSPPTSSHSQGPVPMIPGCSSPTCRPRRPAVVSTDGGPKRRSCSVISSPSAGSGRTADSVAPTGSTASCSSWPSPPSGSMPSLTTSSATDSVTSSKIAPAPATATSSLASAGSDDASRWTAPFPVPFTSSPSPAPPENCHEVSNPLPVCGGGGSCSPSGRGLG